MYRKMRRFKQQLSEEETIHILESCSSGVLGLIGDEGYPYTVPTSYFYVDGKIYIHGANDGYKVDAVKACDKASFCVISEDKVCPEKHTTLYRSVIAFGKIHIIEDDNIKEKIMDKTGIKYSFPDEARKMEIEKRLKFTCLMEIDIEHMTGKESIELKMAKAIS